MKIYKIGYAALGLVGLFLASQEIQAQSLPPLSGITQVAAGGDSLAGHTCALGNTGTVWCWGSNTSGELGKRLNFNTNTPNPLPMMVDGLSGFTVDAIGVGGKHSCAVGHTGPNTTGMVCWGNNNSSQLGNGKNTTTYYPVIVSLPPGTGVTANAAAIALGRYHSCVITAAKGVMCWGDDTEGQVGDNCIASNNCFNPRTTPVAVGGLANVTAISAGTYHTCALINGGPNGTVQCWGHALDGKLGNPGVMTRDSAVPVPVMLFGNPLTGVRAIAAGDSHTCAVMDAGTVKCWGANGSSQLGRIPMISGGPQPLDVPLPSLATVIDSSSQVITAGFKHTCVIIFWNHQALCWGRNAVYELGRNNTTSTSVADRDYVQDAATGLPLTGVFDISSHYEHTCAQMSGGVVKCWGGNESGELGDNTTQKAPVATPTVVDQIFANGFEGPRAN